MKYALSCLLLFLLFSCSDNPSKSTGLCKNKICNDWEQCNKANGFCEAKDGFCNRNSECLGSGAYCDEISHTCYSSEDKCVDVELDYFQDCDKSTGNIIAKEGFCLKNNDCNTLFYCNTESHICENISEGCQTINCNNHGTCVEFETGPKCNCNENYYNLTNTTCIEKTCLNQNTSGNNKETAVKLNGFITNTICEGKDDFYYFTGQNITVKAPPSLQMLIYENDITQNDLLINSISDGSEIYFENSLNKKYYVVLKKINDISNYTISAVSGCTTEYDCPSNYAECSNNKCVAYCDEYVCPVNLSCQNNLCKEKTCTDNSDCGEYEFCMSTGYCRPISLCSDNNQCEGLKTADNLNMFCDKLYYGACLPYYEITQPVFNFDNYKYYPVIYKYSTQYSTKQTINITANNTINNNTDSLMYLMFFNEISLDVNNSIANGNGLFDISDSHNYMPIGDYYLYIDVVYSCSTGDCFDLFGNLSIITERQECQSDNQCINNTISRSSCIDNQCVVNYSEEISNIGERCDVDLNCTTFYHSGNYYSSSCFTSLDYSEEENIYNLQQNCYIDCDDDSDCLNYGSETEYKYCTNIDVYSKCLKECQNDNECIFDLTDSDENWAPNNVFYGSCIYDEIKMTNICKFE